MPAYAALLLEILIVLSRLLAFRLAGSMSRPSSRPSPDPEYVLRSHQAEVQALLFHPSQDLLLSGWVLYACTLVTSDIGTC